MKVDIKIADKLLIILNAFEGEKLTKELIIDILKLFDEIKSL